MNLAYTLTLTDFKAAYRLHRRQRFSRQVAFYFWPALLVACLIGFLACSVLKRIDLAENCVEVGGGALVASVAAPILRFINVRKGYRRLFPSARTERRSYCTVDEECIVREIPGMSQLKVLWSGLFGFAQDDKVTLFYTNKDCFLIIPTQALSFDQGIELRDLVGRHLPKVKR